MLRRSHKRIEVDAGAAADCLVKLRIDIVWSALEGLHLIAFLSEQRHQSSGNGCLARAARGSRYEECPFCCHHHNFCCKSSDNLARITQIDTKKIRKTEKNRVIRVIRAIKVLSLHADNGNLVADAA